MEKLKGPTSYSPLLSSPCDTLAVAAVRLPEVSTAVASSSLVEATSIVTEPAGFFECLSDGRVGTRVSFIFTAVVWSVGSCYRDRKAMLCDGTP